MHDHVLHGILDEASRLLAEQGDAVSLMDIARASGVARSTVYRYFPNRATLLESIAQQAIRELSAGLDDAELDSIPVEDALARLTRGFISIGAKYAALAALAPKPNATAPKDIEAPVLRLLERGLADSSLNASWKATTLLKIYGDLVHGAILRTAHDRRQLEQASADVVSIFLDGARSRPTAYRPRHG